MRAQPITTLLLVLLPGLVHATGLNLTLELPRLGVAEYHRPYVAVWIADTDNRALRNLAVWYDTDLADREGEKWLKDMRQWWRRSGRGLGTPPDAVSGATRPPGTHSLSLRTGEEPLGSLAAGEYRLIVEAAREVGGREMLTLPFAWPPDGGTSAEARGERELGRVRLQLIP